MRSTLIERRPSLRYGWSNGASVTGIDRAASVARPEDEDFASPSLVAGSLPRSAARSAIASDFLLPWRDLASVGDIKGLTNPEQIDSIGSIRRCRLWRCATLSP
jgi:hypothetical protein